MFTGLIEAVGTIAATTADRALLRLDVDLAWPEGAGTVTGLGDSVAVNGTCLTVVARQQRPDGPPTGRSVTGERLTFELSHETLERTCFGSLQVGDRVNLERAMRLGDRLGGHLVTGHVDGVGQLLEIVEQGGAWDLTYAVPPELEAELVVKGSIAVDGVSLTVNATPPSPGPGQWGRFCVTLIPHTAEKTQLLQGGAGKRVHLETDLLAKHVRRLLELSGALTPASQPGVTVGLLQRAGFVS